jgi:glutathione peroxidase
MDKFHGGTWSGHGISRISSRASTIGSDVSSLSADEEPFVNMMPYRATAHRRQTGPYDEAGAGGARICPRRVVEPDCDKKSSANSESFYQFSAPKLAGDCLESFKKYKGKVVMVVNTATLSGDSMEQFTLLNELTKQDGCDKDKLVIVAFPSNTFGDEPACDGEIVNIMKCLRPGKKVCPKLDLYGKVDVNGEGEDPLFTYLKKNLPVPNDDPLWLACSCLTIKWKPLRRTDISSNFEKFIINHRGKPISRHSARAPIKTLLKTIKELIMDATCEERMKKKKEAGEESPCCPVKVCPKRNKKDSDDLAAEPEVPDYHTRRKQFLTRVPRLDDLPGADSMHCNIRMRDEPAAQESMRRRDDNERANQQRGVKRQADTMKNVGADDERAQKQRTDRRHSR